MSGYSISVEEVRATCRRLTADAQGVSAHVDTVLASEVGRQDFGAVSAQGVGARYVEVVHGALADSLRAFDQVGGRLAELLMATFETYQEADDHAHDQLRRGT